MGSCLPAILLGAICSALAGMASGRLDGCAPTLFGTIVMTAVFTGVPNAMVAVSPADRTSEATGMMSVFRAVFQVAGAQLLVIILANSTVSGGDGIKYPDTSAYMLAFGLMAVISVIGFLCALGLDREYSPRGKAGLKPARR